MKWRRACSGHPPPGSITSTTTHVLQQLRHCSWQRTDCSGRQSQQQKALANNASTSRWWRRCYATFYAPRYSTQLLSPKHSWRVVLVTVY